MVISDRLPSRNLDLSRDFLSGRLTPTKAPDAHGPTIAMAGQALMRHAGPTLHAIVANEMLIQRQETR